MPKRHPAFVFLAYLAWSLSLIPGRLMATPPELPGGMPSEGRLPTAIDVRLDAQGRLHGRVWNDAALPAAGVPVQLAESGRAVAQTVSNDVGEFALPLSRGGAYELAVGDRVVLVRSWMPDAAPPTAVDQVSVQASPVLRGQFLGTGLLRNPWVIGGLITTAIVVPIIVFGGDDDDDPSS